MEPHKPTTERPYNRFLAGHPLEEGIIIERREYPEDEKLLTIYSNVPHIVVAHSYDGFEIGYHGSGPADFALNIALALSKRLPHEEYNVESKIQFGKWLEGGNAFIPEVAFRIYQDLKSKWLAPLDGQDDYRIDYEELFQWFKAKAARKGFLKTR